MTRVLSRSLLGSAGLIASMINASAYAQGNLFNPYGNSGYADYYEFTRPSVSNDPSLPGQARLQSGTYSTQSRSNQFGSYLDSFNGDSVDQFNANRGVPSGLPYYQASRLYDQKNGRTYRPNAASTDRLAREREAERNAAYISAMKETDPKKRAVMLQNLERDALQRPLNANANSPESRTAKPKNILDSRDPAARQQIRRGPVSPARNARASAPQPRVTTPATPPRIDAPAAAVAPEPAAITPTAPVSPSPVPIPPPAL